MEKLVLELTSTCCSWSSGPSSWTLTLRRSYLLLLLRRRRPRLCWSSCCKIKKKNVLDRNLAVLRLFVWIPSHVLVASQNVFGPCILACVFNKVALTVVSLQMTLIYSNTCWSCPIWPGISPRSRRRGTAGGWRSLWLRRPARTPLLPSRGGSGPRRSEGRRRRGRWWPGLKKEFIQKLMLWQHNYFFKRKKTSFGQFYCEENADCSSNSCDETILHSKNLKYAVRMSGKNSFFVKFSFLHTWGMHRANEMIHAIPIIMFDLLGVQVQLDKGWQMAYRKNVKKMVGFYIFFRLFWIKGGFLEMCGGAYEVACGTPPPHSLCLWKGKVVEHKITQALQYFRERFSPITFHLHFVSYALVL